MFKLFSIVLRAGGMLLVGAGAGVAVSKSDEIGKGVTALKIGAVGLGAYYLAKNLK